MATREPSSLPQSHLQPGTRHAEAVQVIICDVDATVVDVNDRIGACLRELGVAVPSVPAAAVDMLPKRLRRRFFAAFFSPRNTHLDKPIAAVVEAVRSLQAETRLPLIFLSGRPSAMRKATRKVLDETGLTWEELILRGSKQQGSTVEFKVKAALSRGYEPKHVFDDDQEVLAAFAVAFPGAVLHLVSGDKVTPWLE